MNETCKSTINSRINISNKISIHMYFQAKDREHHCGPSRDLILCKYRQLIHNTTTLLLLSETNKSTINSHITIINFILIHMYFYAKDAETPL